MNEQETKGTRTDLDVGPGTEKVGGAGPDITLYHSPISTCSQKVRLALAEKNLGYVSRVVDLLGGEHTGEAYLKINPNGVVPTLVHDGQTVVDSSVICEYLDDVFPQPPIGPATSIERAQMRAWMRFLEEVPTTAIRAPSLNKLLLDGGLFANARPGGKAFVDRVEKMPLRRHFYREMGPDGFSQDKVDASLDRLRMTLERVERALDGSPYLIGDFSIADIVLLPTVVRLEDLKLDRLWGDLPRVGDWFDRCKARPSFNVAYFAGSRLPQKAGV